ncbi:hypothetical protein [Streptosporangium sp. NPDC087985]|uniref:hypothetical protein n=1 Tax=Streptosporangium sp. NPDC087985 TaxID=3366196 RepID=UPI00381FF783
MPSKRQFVQTAVTCAFAAATVMGLGASSYAQTSIPNTSPAPRASAEDPTPPKARALTAAEIHRKGLSQYIDMSRQQETPPTIIDASKNKLAAGVLAPTRKPQKSSAQNLASGCWYLQTGYSAPNLGGTADHTWCGDGVQVTYTSASCTGGTNWPTYRYEGCQSIESYGVGWNVWDVTDRWHFCTFYNPQTGGCGSRIHPWQKNRYGANGQVWLLGWGNN